MRYIIMVLSGLFPLDCFEAAMAGAIRTVSIPALLCFSVLIIDLQFRLESPISMKLVFSILPLAMVVMVLMLYRHRNMSSINLYSQIIRRKEKS